MGGAVVVTHINNAAESPDSIGSIYGVGAASRILHYGARHHDDVLCRVCQFLDH